jgi:hypothetical protein
VSHSTQSQARDAAVGAEAANPSRFGRKACRQVAEISTPRETILRELLDEAHARIRSLEKAVTALTARL